MMEAHLFESMFFHLCSKMRKQNYISKLLRACNAGQVLKLVCLFEWPLFQMYDLRCGNTLFHGAMFRDFCPKSGCFKKQGSLQHAL